MNADNKMESEMVELHMKNPLNLLTMVLYDPVYIALKSEHND